MSNIKITLVQSTLVWGNISANLDMFTQKIKSLDEETDLIVFPEMFNTGFTMRVSDLSEPMEGPSMEWLAQTAAARSCVCVASLIIRESERYFNRLIWMRPDGSYASYDKRHLFRMMGEDRVFSPGSVRLNTTLGPWRFLPMICYDLRFPVWSRSREDYDCLIYIANWPEARRNAWQILLRARAVENIAYAVGVNRVGEDALGNSFSGDSMAIDYKGKVRSEIPSHGECLTTVTLSLSDLTAFRNAFPAHRDADDFCLL